MSGLLKSAFLVAVVTVGVACGVSIRAGADFAPDVDLMRYETFAWAEADEYPTGDPRLDSNPFFEDRLHRAIEDELSWRGIRFAETEPTLLVHHHISVRDRVQVYNVDERAGYQGGDYGTGSDVFEYEEGTFLVDIADAETKEILWRGWAVAGVDAALSDPDQMTELLNNSVKKMFEEFPRAGGPGA